ncbi:MAG: 50S ribosomal protein L9 [Spirochaetales bacterium]
MNTKVILVQDVMNLGEEGDIKEVKRGYARNYLIPKKLAIPYNKNNVKLIEARKTLIEQKKEEKRKAALGLKERLESLELKIIMPMGENGRLFGSVTNSIIADELQKLGITVEKKKIEIPDHTIKAQGNYKVRVRLYDNQEALLKVLVNPKQDS